MRILAIGNSFSQDAARYLHGVARADGFALDIINLMIGGCSLERHYRNMQAGDRAYSLELNGVATGFCVSLDEALYANFYDVITLQQVSHHAPLYHTYPPYLPALAEHVRSAVPRAKLYLQQTWAYEAGSARLCEELGYREPQEMLRDVRTAYAQAAADIGADGIIPSGEAMMHLASNGIIAHRDTFHASLGVGRYALALTWYGCLTGRDVRGNAFRDFDVPVSEAEINAAQEAAYQALLRIK